MSPLPKGAGGVRCQDCGAHATADGKGTPITLLHLPGCPEFGYTEAEDDLDLGLCPYFLGEGTCSFGCYSEPSCITDRPRDGWPSERTASEREEPS